MPPRKEFSPLSLVLTLVLITACAGVVLAAVKQITEKPIAQAKRQEKLQAIENVLPEHTNAPDQEVVQVGEYALYPGFNAAGEFVGAAVEVGDAGGYGGKITLMIGLDAEGQVCGIQATQLNETPGLGDGITKGKFLDPLMGKGRDDMTWRVTKDGGDVDGVTAATISSRAALRAISVAFEVFAQYRNKALSDAPAVTGATPYNQAWAQDARAKVTR
ncbi:RnfABCDGE type electron transport complex subunit G [bacterium]|nr:RnfABCDGE type electron transport complex subunit G [bacterium]